MIPKIAHFIWYGDQFPWVNVLAIRSLWMRGDVERIVLHHDQDLTATPHWSALSEVDVLETRRLDPAALFSRLPVDKDALLKLHNGLSAPNARANIVRAAILADEGGVYLDLDTITVGPLTSMFGCGVFCGNERIVFPATVARSRDPRVLLRSIGLVAFRDACRRMPRGWRVFRRYEHLFHLAVNNAVLGAEARHPFMLRLLEAMTELPEARRGVPYALGTHLLQAEVARYAGADLEVLKPEVFYPLGPVVSQHWFRLGTSVTLEQVLPHETRVVHWYASVKTKRVAPQIDPSYVRAHEGRQLFSALAAQFL
ncbi:MAG: glycosyl transferase [Deltaproteobacteria bacterium]|nr:glycosyl transferase [Deltaproteobacteria bacterium]